MTELTRRSMLQLVGAAGMAALLGVPSGLEALAGGEGEGGTLDLDVAIVGAGVAGAYSGWRLLTANPGHSAVLRQLLTRHPGRPLRVGLFEASDRIGGRLYSVHPPGMPHLPAEIGGMRVPSTHVLVERLLRHLDLQTVVFPSSAPNNLVYLRGRRFRAQDFANPAMVPYQLPPNERGKSPADLIVQAIDAVVPNGTRLSAYQWDVAKARATFGNRKLADTGMWEVLERTLGQEGYAFVRQGFAYDSFFQQWNAADMMEFLAGDFAPVPTYSRLRRGYQALPLEMATRFHRAGGLVFLNHRVRALRRSTGQDASSIQLDVSRTADGRPLAVHAQHVIVAMPKQSIELLDRASVLFESEQFRRDLQSVTPQGVTRIFLGFREPWWYGRGLRYGRSVTDLPMRQCFYWGVEGEQPGADPTNHNALFFASYADDGSAGYWAGFLEHPPAPGTRHPYSVPGVPPVPPDTRTPVPLVHEIMRQVRELHGPGARIPDPYTALFIDWSQEPYGGAWHFWNIHARSGEVIPRMRHPVPDANVSICGEAWSTDQGWVRGAINTAERVVERQFGLSRPHWMPNDIYLGP